MAKKNKIVENIFDYSEEDNPLFENDSKVLGQGEGDSDNVQTSNSCFPDGAVGGGSDVLPKGSIILDYILIFSGVIDESNERYVGICKKSGDAFYAQRAIGTLSLYKTDKNKKITGDAVVSVQAISGSGGSGCIPNSQYKQNKRMNYFAGRLEKDNNFNDGVLTNGVYEKKHAWKIYIYESFNNRGSFRIHPTRYNQYTGDISSNDGCISPFIIEESVEFFNIISSILTRNNYVIPLNVDVEGNNSITRNIIVKIRKKNEEGEWYDDYIADPKYFENEE